MAIGEKKNKPLKIPKLIQAVLFDLDGTLSNSLSHLYEIYLLFLEKHGRKGSFEEFQSLNGLSLKEIPRKLKMIHSLDFSEEDLMKEYYSILKEKSLESPKLFPFAYECLSYLHEKKIPLGIVTSASKQYVKEFILQNQIAHFFSLIMTSEDVFLGKPAPDIYLKAAQELGCLPEEVVAIEDSYHGMISASDANLHTLWIFSQSFDVKVCPTNVYPIKDWKEILNFFKNYYAKNSLSTS